MTSAKRLLKETIHNHPNYFESKIITGWYEHELFTTTNIKTTNNKFIAYTIYSNNSNGKAIIAKKTNHLKSNDIKKVQKGDCISVNTNLIHRILRFQPYTLSINATFGNIQKKNTTYNVFFHQIQSQKLK